MDASKISKFPNFCTSLPPLTLTVMLQVAATPLAPSTDVLSSVRFRAASAPSNCSNLDLVLMNSDVLGLISSFSPSSSVSDQKNEAREVDHNDDEEENDDDDDDDDDDDEVFSVVVFSKDRPFPATRPPLLLEEVPPHVYWFLVLLLSSVCGIYM